MTVGKMRRLMLKKVVPEKVIPQNIVDFLMDENAELVEPDAFIFLTRLRGLGVGSADFIYLLEGCGAPEEAILRIKSNPAMNLQSLILTMENAGMTSKDYMRILYTARQIWEHTLTSRIDLMESDMLTEEVSEEETANSTLEDSADSTEPDEFRAAFDAVTAENAESKPASNDSTTGFSLGATEEFESLLGGTNAASDYARPVPPLEDEEFDEDFDAAIADSNEIIDEYLDEQNTIIPASPEDLKKDTKDFTVNIDYSTSAEPSAAMATAVEEIAEPVQDEEIYETTPEDKPTAGYNGDTTAIIKIDRTMLEENLANIARNAGAPDQSDSGSEDVAPLPARDEKRTPIDDQYDEDYDYVHGKSRYYIGELTAAIMGALIVAGSGMAAGIVFGIEPPKPIGYAADENEIFTEIYYSHNEKIAGGDSFYRYGMQDLSVFGDLLVERDGLGTFTEGSNVYTFTNESITVNEYSVGEIIYVGTIAPPENTVFADAVQLSDGTIIAAFDGESCGYMKIGEGKSLYTVRQDGSLTDFCADDLEVRLGSVYTPKFYTNFTAANKEVYLPKLGVDYAPIAPQSVIPTKTKGYSYGVAGTYSVESGATIRADAVLGNPVYAAGDGVFAVNSADAGMLLRVDYTNAAPATSETPAVLPKVITFDCGKLVNAAFCRKGSAIFENGSIVLRDTEFNTQSMLQNFSSLPEKMKFSGNTLLVADNDKVFLTVNCSDFKNPAAVELRHARGKVGDYRAVILEQTAEGMRAASYALDGSGKAVLEYESKLPLTGEQRGTLKFGGASTIVASEKLCGAAYSYFDGVSVISEYVLLGSPSKRVMLYDDKKGIDLAFAVDSGEGKVYVNCAKGLVEVEK